MLHVRWPSAMDCRCHCLHASCLAWRWCWTLLHAARWTWHIVGYVGQFVGQYGQYAQITPKLNNFLHLSTIPSRSIGWSHVTSTACAVHRVHLISYTGHTFSQRIDNSQRNSSIHGDTWHSIVTCNYTDCMFLNHIWSRTNSSVITCAHSVRTSASTSFSE